MPLQMTARIILRACRHNCLCSKCNSDGCSRRKLCASTMGVVVPLSFCSLTGLGLHCHFLLHLALICCQSRLGSMFRSSCGYRIWMRLSSRRSGHSSRLPLSATAGCSSSGRPLDFRLAIGFRSWMLKLDYPMAVSWLRQMGHTRSWPSKPMEPSLASLLVSPTSEPGLI